MPNEGYEGIWGWANCNGDLFSVMAAATNLIVGTNPPYSITDLLTLYPKFGGIPTNITGTTDGATGTVTAVSSITGLLTGQYATSAALASGTTVLSATGSGPGAFVVVFSKPTIIAGTPVQFSIFTTPIVPIPVLNAYINLASASLFQARWGEMWYTAMALYVAHFATLWLLGEASGPNATGAQVATSGLAIGIDVSESAGDVSFSQQLLDFNAEVWGTFALTLYGQELITWAQVVGSGMMLFV